MEGCLGSSTPYCFSKCCVVICSRLCSSLLTQHGSTPFGRHPSAGAFSGRHFGAGASGRVLWLDRSSRKAHGFWFCCRNFGFLPKGYFLLPVSNFKNPCALHLGAELGKEAKALRGVGLSCAWVVVGCMCMCCVSLVMLCLVGVWCPLVVGHIRYH
jgi:hypothetical protein